MSSLDLASARAVAERFGIGAVTEPPRPLAGGRAHESYVVSTDAGRYVVKVLRWVEHELWERRFRSALVLEEAARKEGVSSPRTVTVAGTSDLVSEIEIGGRPSRVRVHEFVRGTHPGWEAAERPLARWVGHTLAVIHSLAEPRPADAPRLGAPVAGVDAWKALIDRAEASDAPWATNLAAAMPHVLDLRTFVTRAFSHQQGLLWTHGEVDERSVLVSDGGHPTLIDWDGLWSMCPESELTSAALHWSGATIGEPNPASVNALLIAYGEAGGRLPPFEPRFMGWWIAYQLGWLSLSAQLALGDDIAPLDTHESSPDDLVSAKLAQLPSLVRAGDTWRELFDEWPAR
jgi:phosphotransferase family enzyme